jgi:hypothetical protein
MMLYFCQVGFLSLQSTPGAKFREIVAIAVELVGDQILHVNMQSVCVHVLWGVLELKYNPCPEACSLENGKGLAECMAAFYGARNALVSQRSGTEPAA